MYPHQQATLDVFVNQVKDDDTIIALLLGGSIAKGWQKESSDVDVVLIKTDEAYQAHVAKSELAFFDNEISTYEGGYVDGKIINKQFLRDVISHGSEVARSAFLGAKVILSRDPEIPILIEQICQYPEADREEKIRSFVTQVMLWRWFVGEAVKRDDRFLLLQATSELVLFGSRLMLAHNRLIYPYYKWLRRQLEEAKELPDNYFALMDDLLNNPTPESATAYANAVLQFQGWQIDIREALSIFLKDREWNWRDGKPPIHDW